MLLALDTPTLSFAAPEFPFSTSTNVDGVAARPPPRAPGRPVGRITPTSLERPAPSVVLSDDFQWMAVLRASALRLERLADGWDGVRSISIKKDLAKLAIGIVTKALEGIPRAVSPYLVPGGDGSVQIEWHRKIGELELDLTADGGCSIWIHDRRSGGEFVGENERALALFARWAPRVAALSDNAMDVSQTPTSSVGGFVTEIPLYSDNTVS